MATPPAVAAICFIRLGCCACIGDAIMGAAAGACAGTWLGAARGAGAAMRGAGARIGGEAERPRRGIFFIGCGGGGSVKLRWLINLFKKNKN
jgi:hypothetical protein